MRFWSILLACAVAGCVPVHDTSNMRPAYQTQEQAAACWAAIGTDKRIVPVVSCLNEVEVNHYRINVSGGSNEFTDLLYAHHAKRMALATKVDAGKMSYQDFLAADAQNHAEMRTQAASRYAALSQADAARYSAAQAYQQSLWQAGAAAQNFGRPRSVTCMQTGSMTNCSSF